MEYKLAVRLFTYCHTLLQNVFYVGSQKCNLLMHCSVRFALALRLITNRKVPSFIFNKSHSHQMILAITHWMLNLQFM